MNVLLVHNGELYRGEFSRDPIFAVFVVDCQIITNWMNRISMFIHACISTVMYINEKGVTLPIQEN